MAKVYFAHSGNESGEWDPLANHLGEVADRARRFAAAFDCGDSAHVAGLLHDLGKYGDLFQRRLEGKESGLDHWTAGASVCLESFRQLGIYPALAIQGHHLGLQWWETDELRRLARSEVPEGRRLTEGNPGILVERFRGDGLKLPEAISGPPCDSKSVSAMLDVRMVFSALVDADYLATEQHFQPEAARMREPAAALRPEEAEAALSRHLEKLAVEGGSSPEVRRMRRDLLDACRAAGEAESGLFTLTAPTGTGKTLSTLAFALRHARRHGMRRIVVVLPFLSIIEQTARVYREALAEVAQGEEMERYLLEHHSLALEDIRGEGEGVRLRAMLAENWDLPIVITTSVRLLESLFSNSPAACRKLHRLARSVVIFDEVQTLPVKIVVPTLAALSHLSARYGTSVVFSTATQPAFGHLNGRTREFCSGGWRPREIVPEELGLFVRAQRVRISWPKSGERMSWEELARRFQGLDPALCIVNLKKQAREFFHLLRLRWGSDVFHLSTAMCPRHRAAVLAEVSARLKDKRRCALVATQCVEAGVDLDFPAVFRALGPLDSIAQAAGRCNRNGAMTEGNLSVFIPEDPRYPPGAYKQAAELTAVLLQDSRGLSIDNPADFEKYFRALYDIAKLEHGPLVDAIKTKHFVETWRHYRVIDEDTVNVLVAYELDAYSALADEARAKGLSRDWVRRARPHAVGCFRREVENGHVEPVWVRARAGKQIESGDWFIYLHDQHYDSDAGLSIPEKLDFLEG